MQDNNDSTIQDSRRLEDAVWIGEELRRRNLPQELAAMFAGHDHSESIPAMDAVQSSVQSLVEDHIRKRISGTAPIVGALDNARRDLIRRAFGLRR
ncbi:MAG: hypothetical protein LBS11_00715 [Oscillospiraceae bacterium]|jgi:hypothetical protein|nr:hypothetical protein [Oscillospiraceae bacterium]